MAELDPAGSPSARRSRGQRIPLVQSTGEDGWLMTYLDVITLLLVMFVVMLALSGGPSDTPGQQLTEQVTMARSQAEPTAEADKETVGQPSLSASVRLAREARAFLQEAGLGDRVQVIETPGGISLRISNDILFASGEAALSNPGMTELEKLVPLLNRNEHHITVAGHTDNVPIRSARFPSNWELSSARAGSVVRLLEASGVPAGRMRATGYADTRPEARNDTSRGRARNRRVEILLEAPSETAANDG